MEPRLIDPSHAGNRYAFLTAPVLVSPAYIELCGRIKDLSSEIQSIRDKIAEIETTLRDNLACGDSYASRLDKAKNKLKELSPLSAKMELLLVSVKRAQLTFDDFNTRAKDILAHKSPNPNELIMFISTKYQMDRHKPYMDHLVLESKYTKSYIDIQGLRIKRLIDLLQPMVESVPAAHAKEPVPQPPSKAPNPIQEPAPQPKPAIATIPVVAEKLSFRTVAAAIISYFKR